MLKLNGKLITLIGGVTIISALASCNTSNAMTQENENSQSVERSSYEILLETEPVSRTEKTTIITETKKINPDGTITLEEVELNQRLRNAGREDLIKKYLHYDGK